MSFFHIEKLRHMNPVMWNDSWDDSSIPYWVVREFCERGALVLFKARIYFLTVMRNSCETHLFVCQFLGESFAWPSNAGISLELLP